MFHFSRWVDLLLKAQGHRYLKRIPYMSGGKRRYRYIYKVTHTHQGKQAFDEAHLVEGTAFSLSSQRGNEFHGHVKSVTGDRVTYVIDDGPDKGKEVTESKRDLLAKLNETHGITEQVNKEREKLKQQIELAKQKGSEKQVKLLEERLTRLGGSKKQPQTEPEPQAESTEPQTEPEPRKEKKKRESKKAQTSTSWDYLEYLSRNPESSVYKDLQDRVHLSHEEIDFVARRVIPYEVRTPYEREKSGKTGSLISLLDIDTDKRNILLAYSPLDDAIVLYTKTGNFENSVGHVLDLSGSVWDRHKKTEALAMLALLRDKLDLDQLDSETDVNNMDALLKYRDTVKSAWNEISGKDARSAHIGAILGVAGSAIKEKMEVLKMEYIESRGFVQDRSPSEVSRKEETGLSKADQKKMIAVVKDEKRAHLGGLFVRNGLVATTDGYRILFRDTTIRPSDVPKEDKNTQRPDFKRVIPQSNHPTLTMDKHTIKHLRNTLSGFKKQSDAQVTFRYNNRTTKMDIVVSGFNAGSEYKIASIDSAEQTRDAVLDAKFLRDSLNLVGNSATFHLSNIRGTPVLITGESGLHSVIMEHVE